MTHGEGLGASSSDRIATASQRKASVILLTAPARIGGLESVVASLAMGLATSGRSVVLVQLMLPAAESPLAFAALEHVGLEQVQLRRTSRDYAGARADVRALLEKHAGATLHSHGARADLVAMLACVDGRGFVSTVHGFVTNTVKQRIARMLHLLTLRRATRVVAVSSPLARQLAASVGAGRVKEIPNAVPPTDLLERIAARELLRVPETSTVLGWVGRASLEKGLDVFLEAFARIADRDAVAVIIGDGPERTRVSAQAEQLGVAARVRWIGQVPDAGRFFPAFDVLVLSSRTEGTPMTVLEAVRAGVPVVATAVGGVPDIIGDGAGWLVPPESPSALADAINHALADREERDRRTAVATDRARARFGFDAWIAAHNALYDELPVS